MIQGPVVRVTFAQYAALPPSMKGKLAIHSNLVDEGKTVWFGTREEVAPERNDGPTVIALCGHACRWWASTSIKCCVCRGNGALGALDMCAVCRLAG